ncbi:uncharacterized protein PV09_07155 [Verruconis gallopava]|uniref:Uncharacterized protein n=1 Tax=Verruconis gallopava TaxID=253628 RepID=A0A0D2A3I9_9PEZI|nr:uncharacterized protein PV09_07155 [Verruconis gallopava]KIW01388.1 hypothetical protein PV09_07155 [Verruconis gallopava]
MWTMNQASARLERTGSFHSIASDRSSNASSEDFESYLSGERNAPPAMWTSARSQSNVSRLSQKFNNATIATVEIPSPPTSRDESQLRDNTTEDDARSRSSTLAGEEDNYEYPEKTPTPDSIPKKITELAEETKDGVETAEEEPVPPARVPGPLEVQLQALMSKIIFMERENPTISVTPDEYSELQARVQTLEEERKTWHKRHEALFALRDEDVENIIKVRGLLAKARRDLEGMTKLRDDDLVNLQVVRGKLAEATRKLERLESQSPVTGGRSTPSRGRPSSIMLERRDTTDLFAAAKTAALEQRVMELEKRNSDLLEQIDALRQKAQSTTPSVAAEASKQEDISIDDVNRMAAHKAWRGTVADMEAKLRAKDAEIAVLRAGRAPATQKPGVEWHHIEALHEEHATYREKVGAKMQLLRLEKEMLQKELHRKEDECHELEVKVQSMQRKLRSAV